MSTTAGRDDDDLVAAYIIDLSRLHAGDGGVHDDIVKHVDDSPGHLYVVVRRADYDLLAVAVDHCDDPTIVKHARDLVDHCDDPPIVKHARDLVEHVNDDTA
jgi:hypothetical protein